jgi:copper chaperone CopZ
MKYLIFFSIAFSFLSLPVSAQSDEAASMTTKFKVYGNCGMCEKRIEKAATIEGVFDAQWDVETGMLTVRFDAAKLKPKQIHAAVAAVGHDTDKVRAEDAVYNKLHGCCQYERAPK